MVKYYGRARQRIGSVNTNQLGLKMSGCPSRVGRNPVINRYIKQRVNCMQGTCGPIQIHGVNVPSNKFRNNPPYCKKRSTTCLAAAGGIGNINTPYYRTPAPGEKGCGCKFGSCDAEFISKPVLGTLLIINTVSTVGPVDGGDFAQDTFITAYKTSTADALVSDDLDNVPPWETIFPGVPQNFASYNNNVYQYVYDFEYTSFDIDLSTMNGGDTYRFIISTANTRSSTNTIPLYGQTSTTTAPTPTSTALDPGGIQINYGIAMVDQKPSNQAGVGGILSVPPLSLQNTFIDTNGYYYLTIDLTLSSDKKTVTHTIVT